MNLQIFISSHKSPWTPHNESWVHHHYMIPDAHHESRVKSIYSSLLNINDGLTIHIKYWPLITIENN